MAAVGSSNGALFRLWMAVLAVCVVGIGGMRFAYERFAPNDIPDLEAAARGSALPGTAGAAALPNPAPVALAPTQLASAHSDPPPALAAAAEPPVAAAGPVAAGSTALLGFSGANGPVTANETAAKPPQPEQQSAGSYPQGDPPAIREREHRWSRSRVARRWRDRALAWQRPTFEPQTPASVIGNGG
jgi:hypothetical protein